MKSQEWTWTKESQIQHPSKTPVFADAASFWSWPTEEDFPAVDLQNGVGQWTGMDTETIPRHGSPPSSFPTNWPPQNKLPRAINISFYDGHVAMVPLEQLWQLEWHRDWQTPVIRPGLSGYAH